MTAHIAPRGFSNLREIPCISPPKRNLWLALSVFGGVATILAVSQVALLTGLMTLAGYHHAPPARHGILGAVLPDISLNPPVYLAQGDALSGHYTVQLGKDGLNLKLTHFEIGSSGAALGTSAHVHESGSGSVRLTALVDGWYRPQVTAVPLGKRTTTCGDRFGARSFVENWFLPDPACARHDVAYSITWHVVRKGQ